MMGGGVGTILLLVVLAVAVWAIIKLVPDWQDRLGLSSRRREDSAEETLRQRFARGEIDAQDYERSLEVLRHGRASERSSAKGGVDDE